MQLREQRRGGVAPGGFVVVLALAAIGLCGSACDAIFGSDDAEPARTPGGYNAECGNDNQCRTGLTCIQRKCLPAGNTPAGQLCTLTAECAGGLYCQATASGLGEVRGSCQQAGAGEVDDTCSTDADCEPGLRCELLGFSGTCAATGDVDFGAACASSAQCMAGLVCLEDGTCGKSLFPAGTVPFAGVQCPPDTLEGGFGALFRVPRSGEADTDFYALPFPNDIRRRGGRLDMSGHPRPTLDRVGNVIKSVVELLEVEADGFSPHQTAFFRFNTFPRADTLRVSGESPTIYLVDIDDPESPSFGQRLSLAFTGQSNQGRFICRNWIGVRPIWSQPYQPGRTYAAVVTAGLRGPNDEPPAQSPDFRAVVGDTRPSEPELAAAWDAYANLRAFMADEGLTVTDLAAAAVFTIGRPTRRLPALRAAVEEAGAPSFDALVRCDAGVASPCDDGLTGPEHVRGCFAESDDFYELHTRVDVPIYQVGQAPYLTSGGGIDFEDSGAPIRRRTESVCATLTIPRGAARPEGGWPVVVHAHGTGGNFRSHVTSYASDLSALGYATVGFEGVQHGERRGDSQRDPDALFFNYANPRGVKGSILQGAVDVMVFGRLAASLDVSAASSPTGEDITFNPAQVVFFGHSQGALVGVPALAVDDGYAAAIVSGGGGSLLLSLLEKSSPVDIASGIQGVLGDGALSDTHPFLNLMQLYFDPVDALNYAPGVLRARPEGMAPPHLFVTMGMGDTYTPNRTTQELAHGLGIPVLTPVLQSFGRPEETPPISGNLFIGTYDVTTALGQYEPAAGRDGHFVVFDVAAARAQVLGFLESFVEDGIPTIPAR
jgi:hypothetical protein